MDFLIYITKNEQRAVILKFPQKTSVFDGFRGGCVDILSTLSTISTIRLVDKCTYSFLKKDVLK